MEFKSFMAGIMFLLGMQMLLPFLGVKVEILLPYQPWSTVGIAVLFLLIAYYLFKSN
ncbi:MAG: hypothetical protein N3G80_01200 [Candidatus Micrarchaeota archaeon]|nr:hypothetical protein [Candidatus Micrarchaeota archaeon]